MIELQLFLTNQPIVGFGILAAVVIASFISRSHLIGAYLGVKRSGGRSGYFVIRTREGRVRVRYEVGGTVDFIVYLSQLESETGSPPSDPQRAKAIESLNKWSKALGLTIQTCRNA